MPKAAVISLHAKQVHTTHIPEFNYPEWARGMDAILGTKVKDPLVRWSQRYQTVPTTACHYCGIHYSTLGLSRHEAKCHGNPANKKRKGRR